MRVRPRTYDEIYELQKAVVRTRSGVNFPFYEGDVLRSLLEASSLLDADQYIQVARLPAETDLDSAVGERLDDLAVERGTGGRVSATTATLTGHFQRITGTVGAIALGIGTVVLLPATTTESEVVFTTNVATTIPDGSTNSATLGATAVTLGTRGNGIAAGTNLTLQSPVPNVLRFVVDTASGGGRNRETDEELRERIRNLPAGLARGTNTAISAVLVGVAVSASVIRFARVIEDFVAGLTTVYLDDGSGVPNTIGPVLPGTSDATGPLDRSLAVALLAAGTEVILSTPPNPTTGIPARGIVQINSEQIYYNGHNGVDRLQSLERGILGTVTPASHALGSNVRFIAQTDLVTLAQPQIYVYTTNVPIQTLYRVTTGAFPGAVQRVLNVDFYALTEDGTLAFVVAQPTGTQVRISYTYRGGVVQEAQRIIRGILNNAAYDGYRASGTRVRATPITGRVLANVTGSLRISPAYSADVAVTVARDAVRTYLDNLAVGARAELAKVYDLAMNAPGAEDFEPTFIGRSTDPVGTIGDVLPDNETWVVRAGTMNFA